MLVLLSFCAVLEGRKTKKPPVTFCSSRLCGQQCSVKQVVLDSGENGSTVFGCEVHDECRGVGAACAANGTQDFVPETRDRNGSTTRNVSEQFASTTSCRWDADETQQVCWPRIFLLGAHKTGTTALWKFLMRHPSIVATGTKENNVICELEDEPRSLRRYEMTVGRDLLYKLREHEWRGNPEGVPMYPMEATPSNTFCRGPEGFRARLGIVARLFRPRVVFIHREPVERAWSDFKYFSTFNDVNGLHTCRPTPDLFVRSVDNQTRTLAACAPYFRTGAVPASRAPVSVAACDEELTQQFHFKLPYLPCSHIVRLVPGFGRYFESIWRSEFSRHGLGDAYFYSVRMSEMTSDPDFGRKLWSFLGLSTTFSLDVRGSPRGPNLGKVPHFPPKIGQNHRDGAVVPHTFDFDGVPVPEGAREALATFYRDFDPTVLDRLIL